MYLPADTQQQGNCMP